MSETGLTWKPFFHTKGGHPADHIDWKRSDAVIKSYSGEEIFKQEGVEFPELLLFPFVERVIVALGALDLEPEEQLGRR